MTFQSFGADLRCKAVFRPNTIFTAESAPGGKPLRWDLTRGTPDSYASLKSSAHLNLDNPRLSRSDQSALKSWIDLKRFEPTTLSGVQAERNHHYRPRVSRPLYTNCGTCKSMLPTHIKATILPALRSMNLISARTHQRLDTKQAISAGKFVLVRVQGVLVGAVKLLSAEDYKISKEGFFEYPEGRPAPPVATPSFLAFRNISNEKGELVLAMGGVYMVPKDFLREQVLPEVNKQGPYTHDIEINTIAVPPNTRKFLRDFRVAVVDVDSLVLKPETFLFNAEGVESRANRAILDHLYPAQPRKPVYRALLDTFYSKETALDNITSMKNRWMSFLESLDQVRQYYEQELAYDPSLSSLRQEFERQAPRTDLDDPVVYQLEN